MTKEKSAIPPSPDILESLNPEQRAAVEHVEGPILVLAGAGSGKTRVLTTRVVHLIREHGVPPDRILAVTFTNKAASEMRGRVRAMLGSEPSGLWMGTFHAIGARLLRRHAERVGWTNSFTILDADQSLRLVKRTQESVGVDPKKWSPKAVRSHIGGAKNQLVGPEAYREEHGQAFDLFARNVAKVYPAYQAALADQNAFDFDDLLVKPVELFETHTDVADRYRRRFAFVLVDEYQDTNRAQFRFLELLAREHGNLMVVGDDDQCLLPGTPVSTPAGRTPVEHVGVGESVTAAAGRGRAAAARVEARMERIYHGPVVRLHTESGRELAATPNHLGFARLVADAGLWCVYLMEKDDLGFRVGVTRGVHARRSGDVVHGLHVRVDQERADRAWIVATAGSEGDARFLEALLAARYGLPTTCFHSAGRRLALDDAASHRLYGALDTRARAERLMADLLLFPEHPHHVPGAVVRGGRVRRRVNLALFADGRRYRGREGTDHRVQLCTSGDDLKSAVEASGHPVRDVRLPTWRVESARKDHDEGWGFARRLAATVDGDVRVRARLQEHGTPFGLMPLGHVFPGMEVPVLEEDGTVAAERVVGRRVERYDGPVHDLSVARLRNYAAGGVVVHNSIYGWRGADISNILDFERTFPGARTVRLERNYRSTSKILDAANAVIAENTQRKGKTLHTDRDGGEALTLLEAFDETDEARWIVEEIRTRYEEGPALHNHRDFAVLYRTNAQSRALEDAFRRAGMPYQIVGGVRFYERREIQDVLAYLRLVSNPRDATAFERVVNYPRRGVGDATVERLADFARERGLTLLEAAQASEEAEDLPAVGRRGLRRFADLVQRFSARAASATVGALLEELVEELDLLRELRDEGPEGEDRADNVKELIAGALDFDAEAMIQRGEEGEMDGFTELDLFLQQVALVADIDRHDPDADTVTLMTLHNAKGLEFPMVFIAGLEDGLFPLSRAYDEPSEMEEERRLFYVGLTRAEDKLYLCHARQRRRAGDFTYGRLSPFAEAIPEALLEKRTTPGLQRNAASTPHRRRDEPVRSYSYEPDYEAVDQDAPRLVKGERVRHGTFGSGSVVEISGFGKDTRVVVDFDDAGRKKLLIRYANLEKDWDF